MTWHLTKGIGSLPVEAAVHDGSGLKTLLVTHAFGEDLDHTWRTIREFWIIGRTDLVRRNLERHTVDVFRCLAKWDDACWVLYFSVSSLFGQSHSQHLRLSS